MLEYLRNASEKPVAKFLIALLAFSFVGWGVVDWMNGSTNDDTVAMVGDTPIAINEFEVEKSRFTAQMDDDSRRKTYTDKKAKTEMVQRVLTKMVSQRLVENRANDLEIVVDYDTMVQAARSFPEFQVNGQFSDFAYDSVQRESGLTDGAFTKVLHERVVADMLMEHLDVAMPVPEFVVRAVYDARYAERNIEYATVKYSDFDVAKPTDEQLRDFYAQNPQTVPETRAVSYIVVDVNKENVDGSYDVARQVEDDIIMGDSFQDVAKKHNVKYGHFDAFDANGRPVNKLLTDANVAMIFDLPENQESDMVDMGDKLVFFIVDKINPAGVAEFDSVKKSLVKQWQVAEQKKRAYVRANELLVDLNDSGKLPKKKSVRVSRAKGAPDAVLVAAFRGQAGQNSLVPGADEYFVLSIKDVVAPSVDKKKLADVRREIQGMNKKMLLDDYNSFLKRQYPITINERNYNALIGE